MAAQTNSCSSQKLTHAPELHLFPIRVVGVIRGGMRCFLFCSYSLRKPLAPDSIIMRNW